jgi:hypothetical protein
MLHDFANLLKELISTLLNLGDFGFGFLPIEGTFDVMNENVEKQGNRFLNDVSRTEEIHILQDLQSRIPNNLISDFEFTENDDKLFE